MALAKAETVRNNCLNCAFSVKTPPPNRFGIVFPICDLKRTISCFEIGGRCPSWMSQEKNLARLYLLVFQSISVILPPSKTQDILEPLFFRKK